MKFKLKIHFPCGLKVDQSINTGFLSFNFFKLKNELKDIICPLHGNTCNKILLETIQKLSDSVNDVKS